MKKSMVTASHGYTVFIPHFALTNPGEILYIISTTTNAFLALIQLET